ncbi:MAG: Fur family transcriptional regulator [Thioalkalivibrionaceae bacterium]
MTLRVLRVIASSDCAYNRHMTDSSPAHPRTAASQPPTRLNEGRTIHPPEHARSTRAPNETHHRPASTGDALASTQTPPTPARIVAPQANTQPSGATPDTRARLEHLEHECRARGLRLTPLRRRVFAAIADASGAIKAYELIRQLSDRHGSVKPPSVYRSLAFLIELGFVHRIESLNAFALCHAPGHGHHAVVLLRCRSCGGITELDARSTDHALRAAATLAGFHADHIVLEGLGTCAECRPGSAPSPKRSSDPASTS